MGHAGAAARYGPSPPPLAMAQSACVWLSGPSLPQWRASEFTAVCAADTLDVMFCRFR
ncbi:MAG: hypothetical protein M5U28_47535 [Sandaracinaceae bacterium]|nr:hypothetical protein [Sandaracinaceae bacterium]